MSENFHIDSYERHRIGHDKFFDEAKLNSWEKKDTTDYWRHARMYTNLDPLIDAYPESNWLTVGDGRFGTDANYILSRGIKDVLATDISDSFLKIAKEKDFISKFKIENAESLSFEDNSVDFVLCKEAYHHFPRPMVALYEMLRVAKKSVILIEPQDANILIPSRFNIRTMLKWSNQVFKNFIKKSIGRKVYYNFGNYEQVGNYVYTISEREIEKVGLGLDLEMISFKNMNDMYLDGVEFETRNDDAPLYRKIRSEIERLDHITRKGLQSAGLLVAMIHKSVPNESAIDDLEKLGFDHRRLSRNPYH